MNLGAILAALPGAFAIWVALTASITAALLGWQEMQPSLTKVIKESADSVERAKEKLQ